MATASIRPLAWESPYAMEAALEKDKKKKKKEKKKKKKKKVYLAEKKLWLKMSKSKGNRYQDTGSTEGPKQVEPKQTSTKTYNKNRKG